MNGLSAKSWRGHRADREEIDDDVEADDNGLNRRDLAFYHAVCTLRQLPDHCRPDGRIRNPHDASRVPISRFLLEHQSGQINRSRAWRSATFGLQRGASSRYLPIATG